MKEENFPHARKPVHRKRQEVGSGETSPPVEETAATEVQRTKQRDSRTEDRCRPALTSPRGLSAHLPGTGRGWKLRVGLWRLDPRERTGVGCMNRA